MKKLILCVALLAGMTFVACSDDSNGVPIVPYVGCLVCEIPDTAPSQVEEQPYEVCVDADGIAYVDNAPTNIQASYYFELYCANEFELPTPPVGSTEPGTPTTECLTCAGVSVGGNATPDTEVCKGTNGNAFLEDVDTGMYYGPFIQIQELLTDCN